MEAETIRIRRDIDDGSVQAVGPRIPPEFLMAGRRYQPTIAPTIMPEEQQATGPPGEQERVRREPQGPHRVRERRLGRLRLAEDVPDPHHERERREDQHRRDREDPRDREADDHRVEDDEHPPGHLARRGLAQDDRQGVRAGGTVPRRLVDVLAHEHRRAEDRVRQDARSTAPGIVPVAA